MTREDIIRLMQEACDKDKVDAWHNDFWTVTQEELERFAALVAAAERERMTVNSIHTCHPECDRPGCVRVREAVRAERERICALIYGICESDNEAERIVKAIREGT